jgi:DNA-binding Xre family transcriptional regulator
MLQVERNKRIRKWFIDKDVRVCEISRRTGIDRTTIWRTITGKHKLITKKKRTLRLAICEVLGMSYEDVWMETDKEKAKASAPDIAITSLSDQSHRP